MSKNSINSSSKAKRVLSIPRKLLSPIRSFLLSQLRRLELRRSSLERDDPFVSGRSDNFASPDTTAAEQFGHARSEAMRRELERKTIQIRKALSRIRIGVYGICESCGKMIDTDRLVVFPETTVCIDCERKAESKKR